MKLKKIAVIASAISLSLTLSACSGTGSSKDNAQNDPDKEVTLDFWSNHPGNSKPIEEEMIKAFEAKNPKIKIKLTDAGKNYEEVAQKFNAALSGGQVPDLVVASDVNWYNFALNGNFAKIDDLLKKADAKADDYVESLYNEYTINDAHFAVPYARSTPLFYFNKDLFKKAGLPDKGPATWQEWNDNYAPKLKALGVIPLSIPDGANYMDWYFQGMIWSMDGAYSKDLEVTVADDAGVKAASFLQSQFKNGFFQAAKDSVVPFSTGQAAAMLQSTGSLRGVEKDGKFTVGTAFLPAPEGKSGVSTGGAGIAIPAKSKNQEAAAKFLAFLTNTENTIKFSQATGYMPVRTSALSDEKTKAYIAQHPNFETAIKQLPHTKAQDAARAYVSGGGMKIGAALDKIAQGADVKETLTALQDDLQKQIDTQIKPKLKK
ncbi:sn-glycerol 3-phosphate transport system substrate-binding protein [Arcanobacterium pluranimalium]|uniref:ABC transporter substrate-binding protein n=1 Tax=Arcanobacterium pluranimalium TaxID=108028 RepID=UPI00195D58B8|nr:ABC transporter substrate-binding protein [Arcanobacterium pluranimalium]MBM7825317.1 sn-glycerol 3-phosphate transport system substrate-binding protein [Arcanobacterium pluranimalium]